MQIVAVVVSLAVTAVALAYVVLAVRSILGVVRLGQPDQSRTGNPVGRTLTMLRETMLHTRMLQWTWVGIMHWFVYAGFIVLSSAVAAGYVQLFNPDFALPVIGHWFLFEWVSEGLGLLSTIGIVFLIIHRQRHHPRSEGRGSRFFGSTFWQAYFVEAMALLEGSAILFIRGAEYNLGKLESAHPEDFDRFHFPISSVVGDALYPNVAGSEASLENIIVVIAMIKILLAMAWLIVISRNLTMGVAWHRFTAWFNIWFKREPSGRTALGAAKPLLSAGKPVTLDDIDDLDEDSRLGVGSVEDFSWKGILDFTTCTECGRCQSQCPAWNTEKPLSPKLLVMGLRDAAYAHAAAPSVEGEGDGTTRTLVGKTDADASAGAGAEVTDWFYNPPGGDFVIDEDVLWSCTTCGACVQQCPVDIEHVDHIVDMRRYQVLVESNFPTELNGLFKGLENKGNPWNMSASARMDWAKDLPFEVKVVGETVESLDEVDWLFWVGCAGAYEDRAKKTTRAVAELLDLAGVSFGVLGNGETCSGDPARRAGNEFVFQGLAQQNAEVFKEYKVKKVVSTCAHCFNTLKNEYQQFGVELEVVHHTQLLNRLVREGRLTPVGDGAGAHKRSITYHDPCYVGRHNGVYSPPRELLQVLPGAEYVEMERNSERSFCCGAGGARMWMEENLGERINVNRTNEAVGTGADQIAVGCPFCRVMLSDGLTAAQSRGEAREEVEVLDVAQMLLASVKGEMATKLAPGAGAANGSANGSSPAAAPAAAPAAKARPTDDDVATKAEPEAGDETITDDTVTETADAGPAAKASGGSSLFDDPAESETAAPGKAPAEEAKAAEQAGGSLFDDPSSLFDGPGDTTPSAKAESVPEKNAETAAAESEPAADPADELGSGGSLFDLGGDSAPAEPAPKAAEPASEAAEPAEASAAPTADLGSGGSLFDLQADEPAPKTEAASRSEEQTDKEVEPAAAQVEAEAAKPAPAKPAADLGSGGSLFDIAAPEPVPAETEAKAVEPETSEPEPTAEPEAEAAPEEKPEAATEEPPATAPAPASTIPEGGSLFDIEAPAAPVAKAAESRPEPEPASEPESESKAEPEPNAELEPTTTSGADLSAAATAAANGDATPDPESAADAEPAEDAAWAESEVDAEDAEEVQASEPEPEDEADEADEAEEDDGADEDEPAQPKQSSKPASSGDAHAPKTDVDLTEGGSLFDL
ncbi:(Fe-S)-binding protein [Nocardioides sp. SYSU D00038]|uniref:(Fe-S)-binding protein n=1 Tax=Nocardioides sp. SYSU D00038 TaxID=2812554 RepID=UPI001967DD24|nr:(Fe-S)-binding protein [Nocardioides sp. SYSU D00038]